MFYADYINTLGGNVHSITKHAEYLEFASKKTGLEVNVVKHKSMVMSPDQNGGRSHGVKVGNSCFGNTYGKPQGTKI